MRVSAVPGMMEKEKERTCICIDLKSFYASVECVERGLDPLACNLVVADTSRTEKTICLAVSPALKSFGIPGRPRLFEVVQKVRDINAKRLLKAHRHEFAGKSADIREFRKNPELQLDYVAAVPRMSLYIRYSTDIYKIYLKYIAPEDIHVYSIDEVFMDVTDYLHIYHMTARELAMQMIHEILKQTGITATCGIGTNLYLGKIAMDIVAKHMPADRDGIRIAELNEKRYRELLWTHRPLTDFWRVGAGYAKKLEEQGLYTMGDIARCSLGGPSDYYNEDLLYRMFGINAQLLIDHAWGWESCTMADIKAYRPDDHSLGSGQVLPCPYDWQKARIVVREMAESLAMELFEKKKLTDQIVLTISYDASSLDDPQVKKAWHGKLRKDYYGRTVPEHAHGSENLNGSTSSASRIADAALAVYDRCVNPLLPVRKIYVTAAHVVDEKDAAENSCFQQMDLFSYLSGRGQWEGQPDPESTAGNLNSGEFSGWQDADEMLTHKAEGTAQTESSRERAEKRERRLQEAEQKIRSKYGKNALLKGTDLQEGATAIRRNSQIGGHRA